MEKFTDFLKESNLNEFSEEQRDLFNETLDVLANQKSSYRKKDLTKLVESALEQVVINKIEELKSSSKVIKSEVMSEIKKRWGF